MIQQKLEQILLDQQWDRFRFDITVKESPVLLQAGIDDQGEWNIRIHADEKVAQIDQLLKDVQIGKKKFFRNKDNLDNMLYFVVSHEIGHWKYCPSHIDYREQILAGVSRGIRIELSASDVEKYAHTLYNAFADLILNVMAMYRDNEKEKFADGFLAFYAKEAIRNKSTFSDVFYIIIDTMARLGLDDAQAKGFAEQFNDKHKDLSKVSQEILSVLLRDETAAAYVMNNDLTLPQKIKIYHELNQKDLWYEKAGQFARLLAPYLLPTNHEMPSIGSCEWVHQQHQQEQQEQSQQEQQKGQQEQESGQSQEKNTEETDKEKTGNSLRDRLRKLLKKLGPKSNDEKIAALDEHYTSCAEKIVIDMSQKEGPKLLLPICYLQRKEIEEGRIDFGAVDWNNPELGFDKDGKEEIIFMERQHPLHDNHAGYQAGGRIPNLLLIIDTSPSMMSGMGTSFTRRGSSGFSGGRISRGEYNITWSNEELGTIRSFVGTESRSNNHGIVRPYDMLLRSVYSVFHCLRESGDLEYMQLGTILFDDLPNYFSGWHSYFDLMSVKSPLLVPSAFGMQNYGTKLNPHIVKQATDESDGRFWALIVSDGQIQNHPGCLHAVSYLAHQGNDISFIRIGSPSLIQTAGDLFYEHVKQVGGSVHTVSQPDDLTKLVLKQAKTVFSW